VVAIVAALAVVLSSCRLTVRPDIGIATTIRIGAGATGLINFFEPTRGRGSTYFIGEEIDFRIGLRTSGFLTIIVRDPSGVVSQVFPAPGFFDPPRLGPGMFTLPLSWTWHRVRVGPLAGYHEVRAIFTPEWPGARSRITFRGYFSNDDFDSAIEIFIHPFPPGRADVATTYFFAR